MSGYNKIHWFKNGTDEKDHLFLSEDCFPFICDTV